MSESIFRPAKVFISYSHDSESHKRRVQALAERVRSAGLACRIDQEIDEPGEGWPLWTMREIESSDFVLAIFTENYERRFLGREDAGIGLGATWEGRIIIECVYYRKHPEKVISIVFDAKDQEHIPLGLRGLYFDLESAEGPRRLIAHMTRAAARPSPPAASQASDAPHASQSIDQRKPAPEAVLAIREMRTLKNLAELGGEFLRVASWPEALHAYQALVELASIRKPRWYAYGLEQLGRVYWLAGETAKAEGRWWLSRQIYLEFEPDEAMSMQRRIDSLKG